MKKQKWLTCLYLIIAIITLACFATRPVLPQQPLNAPPSNPLSQPNGVAVKPGTYKQFVNNDGTNRLYLLHVPQGYDGSTPLPLVFVLHGFGGNASGMVQLTGFSEKADQANFFVAYLNGTEVALPDNGGSGQAWNNGLTPELDLKVDDIAFIRDLLKDLLGKINLDVKRIYAAGFSNGAMMSHRLGAELSDVLAGIAVVEGTIGFTEADGSVVAIPKPIGSIPVVIIHGKADPNLPYDGGESSAGHSTGSTRSAADAVAFWTQADGCSGAPQQEISANGNIIKQDYTTCADGSEVLFYTVVNGQHEWPTLQGHTNFSATDAIWDFFSRHSK